MAFTHDFLLRPAFALAIISAAACGGDADPWDFAPECAGASPDLACLTIKAQISGNGTVRTDATGDLAGELVWAFSLVGGTTQVSGSLPDVDLSAEGASASTTLKDVELGTYTWLAYLDDDGSGDLSAGDPLFESSETAAGQMVELEAGHAVTVYANFKRVATGQ